MNSLKEQIRKEIQNLKPQKQYYDFEVEKILKNFERLIDEATNQIQQKAKSIDYWLNSYTIENLQKKGRLVFESDVLAVLVDSQEKQKEVI